MMRRQRSRAAWLGCGMAATLLAALALPWVSGRGQEAPDIKPAVTSSPSSLPGPMDSIEAAKRAVEEVLRLEKQRADLQKQLRATEEGLKGALQRLAQLGFIRA